MPEPPFERECQKSEIGLVSTIYLSTEKYIVFLSLNYLIGKQAGFATCRPCSQGSAHKLASEPQSDKVKANDKVSFNHSKTVCYPIRRLELVWQLEIGRVHFRQAGTLKDRQVGSAAKKTA